MKNVVGKIVVIMGLPILASFAVSCAEQAKAQTEDDVSATQLAATEAELATAKAQLAEISEAIKAIDYKSVSQLIADFLTLLNSDYGSMLEQLNDANAQLAKTKTELEATSARLSGDIANDHYALGRAYQAASNLCPVFNMYRNDAQYEYYFAVVRFYKHDGSNYTVNNPTDKSWDIESHWANGEYPIIGLPKGTKGDPLVFIGAGELQNAGTDEEARTFGFYEIEERNFIGQRLLPFRYDALQVRHRTETFQIETIFGEIGDFNYVKDGDLQNAIEQEYDINASASETVNTFTRGSYKKREMLMPCFKVPPQNNRGKTRST